MGSLWGLVRGRGSGLRVKAKRAIGVGIDGMSWPAYRWSLSSEVPDLPGVHDCSRYLMKATLQSQGPLEATGGLHVRCRVTLSGLLAN